MSYQVGSYCYTDLQSAGAASCASFSPVSSINNDGTLRTVSCETSNASGALILKVATTQEGQPTTYTSITQQIAYQDCQQGQIISAQVQLFGAILAACAVCYAVWRMVQYFNHSRGD